MPENHVTNIKWSSQLEFYASLIGYSIGMPEFWRVPYLTFRNGGGTFIAVYSVLMLVCGIPLYFLEVALSQFSGKGPWGIWDVCPLLRGIGVGQAVINGISSVNAAILVAWAFEYFVNSFKSTLPWTTCDNSWNTDSCYVGTKHSNYAFQNVTSDNTSAAQTNYSAFNTTSGTKLQVDAVNEYWLYGILRISDGISQLGTVSGMFVLYLFVMRLLAGISVIKSVQSVGKLMIVTALLPIVLVIVIWVRALTLQGSLKGMEKFVNPDWSKLGDPQLWTEASFQTFMTLGPGWGGLFMFGCHNKFRTNSLRAALVSTATTLGFGLLNGLVVFSVLGVMSEELGVPIDSVLTTGGFAIGFIAYPKALSYFPLPQFWCALFYVVLLLPAFDALAIFTEPYLLVIEEIFSGKLSKKRIHLLTIASVLAFLLGIPYATQSGAYIFLLVDWYTGTWSVMFFCLAECIVFCWIYGGHRIDRDIKLMLGRSLPALIRISCAFVMPIFMLILLTISVLTYQPPTFGKYSFPDYARGIGWCFTLSSILPCIFCCLWTVKKANGSLKERLQTLIHRNMTWLPNDEDAVTVYKDSEKTSKKSLKELFLFNLLGRGEIHVDKLDITNNVPLL